MFSLVVAPGRTSGYPDIMMRTVVAALILAGSALAQREAVPQPNVPTVRAQGRATVSARPDQVRIDIGVVSQGKTAKAAAAANATLFSEVMAALKGLVGTGGEIQTAGYSVHPDYRYPREGGTPTIAGYTATNVVRVTTSKVEGAGDIIDAVSTKGANAIRGIHFSVKDERALRGRALREAARNARENADAMASGLGLKVLRVQRIEEAGAPIVRPMQMEMMQARAAAADAAPPTPVAPGEIEVEAQVTITAELGVNP
jgi:uncharacterized protein